MLRQGEIVNTEEDLGFELRTLTVSSQLPFLAITGR